MMDKVKTLLDSVIFQSAMEQVPVSIVITDTTPKILHANKFFTELTGYSIDEVRGENPNILNSGTHSKEFFKNMWNTLTSGNVWKGEIRNVRKDGSYFWERASIAPYYNDGEIRYYVAIKEDITKEKESTEKAERRERLLNNIQVLSGTGGWEYDPFIEKFFWTDELYKIHGFSKSFDGNLAEESLKCYDESDREKITELYDKCLNDGVAYDYTARFTDMQGNKKWVRTKTQAVKNHKGEIIRIVGSVRDVTDEVETLHILKRRQTEFQTLVESFDDIVYTIDKEGRFTNLYGKWARDEELSTMMLGSTAKEVFGEKNGKVHRDALKIADKEGHFTYKWFIQNEKGQKNHYETKLTRLRGNEMEDSGFLGVGRNVTKEIRYRQELEDLKERLNYALVGTRAGTWDWDIETGKTIFNERWAQMLGYSLSELEPTYIETWNNLTHPEDLIRAENELHQYFRGDIPVYDVKVRMQHKEGHWVWVWDRGAIFEEDENGRPQRMVGTHIDISDWMKAEERLKKSERKYRELFENSSDPSILEKNGHIMDCNQAVLDLLGYEKKNDLIGKGMLEISPKTQSNGWESEHLYKTTLDEIRNFKKKGLKFEWEHLSKHGEIVPVETVVTNLTDNDGESIRYVVWRDITDRKAAEKELLDAYEERGALLAEIHHRVKNNLAIISGLIQLQIFGTEDDQAAEQLNKSVNRIKSIALIHEQLYQSKSFSNISLKDNIEKQANTLFDMYKSKNSAEVNLKLSLEDIQININQALPIGLLMNEILNNAFKHAFVGRDKGEVRIEVSESDNRVQLGIKDDGVGIPDEEEKGKSLGQTLINTFIKQLRADVDMDTENGTSYQISFEKQDLKGTMASNMSILN